MRLSSLGIKVRICIEIEVENQNEIRSLVINIHLSTSVCVLLSYQSVLGSRKK